VTSLAPVPVPTVPSLIGPKPLGNTENLDTEGTLEAMWSSLHDTRRRVLRQRRQSLALKTYQRQMRWDTLVIPATQAAEVGGSQVQSQLW
jgi:hypothetical protein